MMSARLMIYGATGYTGQLLSARAKKVGLDFVVAGRNPERTADLGKNLSVEHRSFSIDDAAALRENLDSIACILHCAGPFSKTAAQVLDACLERKVHYIDITGEYGVFALAEQLSAKAEAAGVMLMPGVGWDVVPSDCLALHTARRVAKPHKLRLGLKHFGAVSRGSAVSGGEIFALGPMARRGGVIVKPADLHPTTFDFGYGPEHCIPAPMGDLITAWKSARVPNIEVFFQVPKDPPPAVDPKLMPDGPTAEERAAGRSRLIAEVTDTEGKVVRSMMETASGYTYTGESGIEVARRILAGDFKKGFQSPASAYGVGLAISVGGATITDLS